MNVCFKFITPASVQVLSVGVKKCGCWWMCGGVDVDVGDCVVSGSIIKSKLLQIYSAKQLMGLDWQIEAFCKLKKLALNTNLISVCQMKDN